MSTAGPEASSPLSSPSWSTSRATRPSSTSATGTSSPTGPTVRRTPASGRPSGSTSTELPKHWRSDVAKDPHALPKRIYKDELERLQIELVKLQQWVREEKERVVVVFEGRDAAGKGGVIRR